MRRTIWSLCFVFLAGYLFGADAEDILRKANEAYRSNDFAQAIENYEDILDQGLESKAVYYNLGNAYYRQGKLGKAILNFERARLLAPKDEDIKHNLKVARQQLQDDIKELPPFFLARWWHSGRMGLSASGWGMVALVLFWLGVGGLIVWILAPSRRQKKMGFVSGIVLLILFVLPLSLAISRYTFEKNTQIAIITTPEVSLRAGAAAESTELMELHEGTKVYLLDQIDEWYKVMLINRDEGWLLGEEIEEI